MLLVTVPLGFLSAFGLRVSRPPLFLLPMACSLCSDAAQMLLRCCWICLSGLRPEPMLVVRTVGLRARKRKA